MKSYGKVKKLGFPYVFILCCLFFTIVGFFFFSLFSQGGHPVRRSVNEAGDGSVSNIPFQVLSWKPRIFHFPNFATKQQCQAIMDMAKNKLTPSKLSSKFGQESKTTQNVRTSTGVFISADDDKTKILAAIEEKIAIATKIPRDHYEPSNILRYKLGQKYDSHYDAFNPEQFGAHVSQRLGSFLLYLSSVEEGGETIFPFENERNMDGTYDYKKCIGLKVKPRQGDAIFFYNLMPNGTTDVTSLHGSCPVIKGEKWVATTWIRDQSFDDYAANFVKVQSHLQVKQ